MINRIAIILNCIAVYIATLLFIFKSNNPEWDACNMYIVSPTSLSVSRSWSYDSLMLSASSTCTVTYIIYIPENKTRD